jgi:hypothetical protein
MDPPHPPLHCYATTNVSVDQSHMLATDLFLIGDRVLVHGNLSRHLGRVATVNKVGARRLSLTFEDGLPGAYVWVKDTLLLPYMGLNAYTFDSYNMLELDLQGHLVPLDTNRILAQFSITATSAIAQHYDDEMEMDRLVEHFAYELRCNMATRATWLREREE